MLTILFAALSVFFFFQFKIRDVFNAITGRAQRKSVQQMEEENAKTGKLRQDYYSAPTSSDLYTTPSGRIPPVMSAQQAAGGQADGAAYTEQVYHSADPEGREHTMQLHTAQQAASDNGGSEATTLLNSGSEETTQRQKRRHSGTKKCRIRRNNFIDAGNGSIVCSGKDK